MFKIGDKVTSKYRPPSIPTEAIGTIVQFHYNGNVCVYWGQEYRTNARSVGLRIGNYGHEGGNIGNGDSYGHWFVTPDHLTLIHRPNIKKGYGLFISKIESTKS